MKRRRIGFILYLVVLVGIVILIDYSNSKYTESELEYILANEINEIYEGEEST